MSESFWVLYDPKNKLQTEKMTENEMQFSLLKLRSNELTSFLIWKNDWEKWKKLEEFLKTAESPFLTTFLAKPSTKNRDEEETKTSIKMVAADRSTVSRVQSSFSNVKVAEVSIEEVFSIGQQQFDAEQLDAHSNETDVSFKSLNRKNAFSKRNKDDKHKLELLLSTNKGQMFRTTAQNVSLTGTFSERIVPNEFHDQVFNLVIINNLISNEHYKRVSLSAKVIITDASVYLQFLNTTEEQKQKLRFILDAYLREQKKLQAS